MGRSPFASKPELPGRAVLLRPFRAEDADPMMRILADPEIGRLTGSVHSTADASTEDLAPETVREWYATRADQDDRLDLAVVDRSDGEVVGEVVLNHWEPGNASCNFRTLIGPSGRGRGLGTEASRLLLAHAFDVVGLHRVDLEVFSSNPRARRVYEKVGFVHEGTKREALCFDGEWIDAVIMSILAAEWAEHRGQPFAE